MSRRVVWRPEHVLSGWHADVDDDGGGVIHAGESWAGSSYLVGQHEHAGWELYLQAHGTTTWAVRSRVFRLRPHDALAIPPQTPHAMVERADARHHFFYLAVDMATVGSRVPALAPYWAGTTPVRRSGATSLELPFRHLVREVGHDHPLGLEGIRAAADLVVIEATRTVMMHASRRTTYRVHPAVDRARRLLDEQPDRSWRVGALAAEVGLSATYLVELFTRDVGMPPHRYLVERRVERALELLTATDASVARIAADLGFASGSHLARAVRATTQLTPTQVRRLARSDAQPS